MDPRLPLPPNLDPRGGQPPRPRPAAAPQQPPSPPPYGPPTARPPAMPPDRRGRSTRQRFGLAGKILAALLSATILVASGWLWALVNEFNANVNRVDAIGSNNGGGSDVDGEDQNILLVGNDNRGGIPDDVLRELGTEDESGFNTDTMLLVHLPADGRKATAVSFPRDLNVFIPALGREGKINSAYANGACPNNACGKILTKQQQAAGARALVDTISRFSGLRIDHYVEVGLLGFYNITNVLNGIEVCLKNPVQDRFSAIDLPAGRQTIKGKQALAFVRQRHGLPNGAYSRIQRQQYFLGAVFRKMTSAGVLANPLKQQDLVKAVAKSLTMDADLNPLDLARQMQHLTAGNLQFLTVPISGSGKNAAGQSVDLPDESKLPAFWKQVTGNTGTSKPAGGGSTAAPTVPRGSVTVSVFNGTGRGGLASQTARELRELGFRTGTTGNASTTSATVIRYGAGQEAAARTLAAVVPGAQLTADDSISGVRLVLGANFSGLKSSGTTSGAGTNSPPPSSSNTGGTPPPSTAADAGCID